MQLIPDPSQRVFMSHLFTYGLQDFNKNIEVVEQDLTGNLDAILEKVIKWKHSNINQNQEKELHL